MPEREHGGDLLRRVNPVVTRILVELREKLAPFYSDIGRPSIDPEQLIGPAEYVVSVSKHRGGGVVDQKIRTQPNVESRIAAHNSPRPIDPHQCA